ncbi:MAG: S-layer homology domain-containing protein [Oscillospiraceae bacterium]|nr:S-layer homology domain-containing protein [Oscillospiraceae bacterium]
MMDLGRRHSVGAVALACIFVLGLMVLPSTTSANSYDEVEVYEVVSGVESGIINSGASGQNEWTLEEAVNYVNSNSTTEFVLNVIDNIDVGAYGTQTISNTAGVTIHSDTAGTPWVLTNDTGRHFKVASNGVLSLENITLDGGATAGGIEVQSGCTFVMLGGATLQNCRNTLGGGASVSGGSFMMYDGAVIQDCIAPTDMGVTADGFGGAVMVSNGGTLQMRDGALVQDCEAGSLGGGIYLKDSTFIMGVATVTECRATTGGGVSATGSTIEIDGGIIKGNTAETYGGGLNLITCQVNMDFAGVIEGNEAEKGSGNGVYISNGTFNLKDGAIRENQSATTYRMGGGVFVTGANAQFNMYDDGEISGNYGTDGAGIFVTSDAIFNMFGGSITGNTAQYRGGGAYIWGAEMNMSGGMIEGNACDGSDAVIATGAVLNGARGSGIYASGGVVSILGDADVSNNVSADCADSIGGGIFAQNASVITLSDQVSIHNNEANAGGGVYLIMSELTMSDSANISYNSARQNAGGVAAQGNTSSAGVVSQSTVTLSDSASVHDNISIKNGGGFFIAEDAKLITQPGNVSIINNSAGDEGGAIYTRDYTAYPDGYCIAATDYQSIQTDSSTIFSGNTADGLYTPPTDAALYTWLGFASVSDASVTHPLNNYDINYHNYTLTYDDNYSGGAGYSEGPYYYNDASTVKGYGDTGLTARSGYTFQKWNTAADGSGTSYAAGASITVTGDTTLYAQWSYNGGGGGGSTTYSVTYNANGGTGSYRDSGISSGTSYSVLSGTDTGISYSGYTLRGWNTSADGTGTSYAVGDTVTIRSSITLYAVWTEGEDDGYLRVTYYPNGATSGDVPVDSTLYHSGDTVTVLYNTGLLRRSGYYFSGWALTESGGTVLRPGTQFTMGDANVQLYARWSASTSGGSSLETLYDTEVPLATLTTDHIWYIQGYPDNSVKPDGNLTRAEAAAIFYRLIDDANGKAQTDYAISFGDVTQSNWYYHEVAYLTNRGILFGYEDGTFRGDAPISRAEFAAIASRFDALWLGTDNAFSDVSESHWAVQYINSAAEKGWITGYADGTFRPDQSISRAEAVTLINRVLGRSLTAGNEPDGLHSYIDLDNTYWAYYDIMEASHTHDYERNDAQEEVWTTYSYAQG